MTTENNPMTQPTKIQIIAEKVKAFIYGGIGSLFFTLGFSYFSEKEYYRVPRILMPIFEFFGNIGLAVGLLILGGFLIFKAYHKFTKFGGKPAVMLIVLPLFVVTSFGITKLSEKTYQPNSEKHKRRFKEERDQLANEIKNAKRPKLDNPKANVYFDKLENLLKEMSHAKEINDEEIFTALDKEYLQEIEVISDLIPVISKTDQYRDFILYNANLSEKINKLRGIDNH